MNERVIKIVVPPLLTVALDELAREYSVLHSEDFAASRRVVEIAVLQFGMRELQADITRVSNKELCERMGWPVEEEEEPR